MSPASVHPGGGTWSREGFSLLEMLIVMVIATVLMGIMFSSFQKGSASRSALSARDTYIWMARRARALALQRGLNTQIRLAPDSARVVIARTNPDSVLELRYFKKDFGTTTITTGSGDSVMICFRPRGFAIPCGPTTLPTTVTFTVRTQSANATVQAQGQVEATP